MDVCEGAGCMRVHLCCLELELLVCILCELIYAQAHLCVSVCFCVPTSNIHAHVRRSWNKIMHLKRSQAFIQICMETHRFSFCTDIHAKAI